MPYTVRFSFEGSIDVEVFANPDNAEDWAGALAAAWAHLTNFQLGEAITEQVTGHEIIAQADTEECSMCRDMVPFILICPDGAEICQTCFDKGYHLTEKQVKAYIESEGILCLLCGGFVASVGPEDYYDSTDQFYIEVACTKCEAQFDEVYALSSLERIG